MDAPVSRRRALRGAAAALSALAGCGDRPPRRTSRAVIVTNVTGSEFTATVRMYALPDGVTVTDAPTDGTAAGESTAAGDTPTAGGSTTPAATGESAATPTPAGPSTDDLEEVLVRRETVSSEESFGVPGDTLPGGDLRVLVTTTDGQSDSYDWARLDERSTLDVRIGENAVRFTELD